MNRLDELNSAIRTEKDLKVRTRLMAVRAVLELGHSTETMAAVFDVTARCIRRWVERFNRDGPEGLRDKPKSGRPRAVPAYDIRQAAAELHQKTSLTPKRLREKIMGLTGVRYAVSYVRKMLCTLGFSKRIPDPVHVNASTNQQCTRWYEETMHLISRLKRRGFTVITQDESFFVNDVIRGYKLWAPVGVPIHVPYTGSHKKVVGYGAIADDRTQMFRIYEKFDTATFIRYLDELRHKYGKILVLVDGAAPHRSKATMDYLAKHHATVALRRFPVGAPHMNAVEETWRRSKLDTLVCEYHGSLEGMKKQLSEYFRTTRFNLDLFKYLRRRLLSEIT